jgi:hypothetical protein
MQIWSVRCSIPYKPDFSFGPFPSIHFPPSISLCVFKLTSEFFFFFWLFVCSGRQLFFSIAFRRLVSHNLLDSIHFLIAVVGVMHSNFVAVWDGNRG